MTEHEPWGLVGDSEPDWDPTHRRSLARNREPEPAATAVAVGGVLQGQGGPDDHLVGHLRGETTTPYSVSTFQERPPPAALAEIVTCMWVQHIPAMSVPYLHTRTPDGSIEIAYQLDGGARPRIIGPRTRPTREAIAPGTTTVGIRFRPGASAGVLGIPASKLVDQTVDLRDVWGSPVDRLVDELAIADTSDMVASCLMGAVHRASIGPSHPDPVVQLIIQSLRQNAKLLPDIGHVVGLSDRQVRRRCINAVGYGAKTLQRIVRFQRLLAAAHSEMEERLADLAVEHGYADQAHLTSESRRLTGLPPATFITEMRASCAAHDHRASRRTWQPVERAPA